MLSGRYQLRAVIGTGGMSVVWRAHDAVLGRMVAVKLLSGRYSTDPVSRQRIRQEARAAAALAHPNIAQVYDFGEADDNGQPAPFVVMELVAGMTVEARLAAGPLPQRAVFRLCAEVAAALAAAHADGLVHRDIKPANIMIAPTGAKVVDFGIAAAISPDALPDSDEELLGTPSYLAPERLTDTIVEPASDVYSLGVLLYRLLAGQMPWITTGVTQILEAHLYTDPAPFPPQIGVPGAVAQLCEACLRKDPAARPTARKAAIVLAEAAGVRPVDDDLAHALAPSTINGEPSTVLLPRRPPTGRTDMRTRTPGRRRGLIFAGLAIAAAAAISWPPLGELSTPHAQAAAAPRETDPPALAGSAAAAVSSPTAPGTHPTLAPTPAPTTPAARNAGDGPPASATDHGMGGRATGSGNTGGATAPGAPAATTAPAPVGGGATPPVQRTATYSSTAGSVTATCTGGTAQLTSWTATKPYKVDSTTAGPAPTTAITFRHGNTLVQMAITCSHGEPAETTTTSSR